MKLAKSAVDPQNDETNLDVKDSQIIGNNRLAIENIKINHICNIIRKTSFTINNRENGSN